MGAEPISEATSTDRFHSCHRIPQTERSLRAARFAAEQNEFVHDDVEVFRLQVELPDVAGPSPLHAVIDVVLGNPPMCTRQPARPSYRCREDVGAFRLGGVEAASRDRAWWRDLWC
jgi:hypothetical protein